MKDEEIDWLVYHIVIRQDLIDVSELARASGLDRGTLEASLRRLENNLLVEQRTGEVKALSVNEALIRCQIKYDASLPYMIENGVIKEKKRQGP